MPLGVDPLELSVPPVTEQDQPGPNSRREAARHRLQEALKIHCDA